MPAMLKVPYLTLEGYGGTIRVLVGVEEDLSSEERCQAS